MLNYIKEHKFDSTEGLANMMVKLVMVTVIVTASLLSPASVLSLTHTSVIVYALTDVTGANETENVPNLITTPSPLISSVDRTDGGADVNRANTTQLEPPTQSVNQTQQSTLRADLGSEIVRDLASGQGNQQTQVSNNPLLKPITKVQAAEAEEKANTMIKSYNEELEEKNEASMLAAAELNQTMDVLQEETRCVAGEVSAQVGNSTVCLSSYEISVACNPGGSLVGDPICSNVSNSSILQPIPGQITPEEEVIDETAEQGQQPGSGEEEVLEEGDAEEQEVIEDFE